MGDHHLPNAPRHDQVTRTRTVRSWTGALLVVVVLATTLLVTGAAAPVAQAAPPFTAQGSVNQVYTYGHPAGAAVDLLDSVNTVVANGVADSQGAYLFRTVAKGVGYQVRQGGATVAPLSVTDPTDNPPFSFYQSIDLGAGVAGTSRHTYIPTRDGTLLSANIVFPNDGSKGPWPVLIDYSGYDPSEPSTTGPPEAALYPLAGYVTVGINLRGTTCSGGAFDLFETLQTLDGYDAIEALAAQPWSTGHVGMVGISYHGIAQLFVAQTQPPHLDAITPLSTYADFYDGIGYPGGIINSGFFLDWLRERDADSRPAAHGWVKKLIKNGDTTCAANQVMRGQSHDLTPEALPNRLNEARGTYLSPKNFVDKIKVPTLLVGQFQDEQTGGQWSTMVDDFDPATKLRVQLTNGTHIEGMGPEHIGRIVEFVDFYVAHRVPVMSPLLRAAVPVVLAGLFNDDATVAPYNLPIDRFGCYAAPPRRPAETPDCTGIPVPVTDNYAGARAAFEAEPPVHVSWENGNGPAPHTAGQPFSSFQGDYASWPLPGVTAQPYYLQPDGHLAATAPAIADTETRAFSSYAYDPSSKHPKRTFNGGTSGMWAPLPNVNWKPLSEGNSLNFVTDPMTTDTAFAGWGSADLWLRSTEADTDVEVTLTEVRPDGKETFIQSGWLRASHRKLDVGSDELTATHSNLAGDIEPLPAGEFVLARVAIFPFAHVLRPGSRLRMNIEVPGGNQAFWQIDPMTFGHPVTNDIGHSAARPSRVVLPLVPAAETPAVPADLPPCPALRGQACRPYLPARIVTGVEAVVAGPNLDLSWIPPTGVTPDRYEIHVIGSDEIFTVPGTDSSFTYPSAPPGTALSFRVAAVFGSTVAPPSDASLAAMVPAVIVPTTSTSTQPPSSSTSTAPPPSTTAATGPTSTARPTVGTLPTTGSTIAPWLEAAALFALVGAALVVVTRRRRT